MGIELRNWGLLAAILLPIGVGTGCDSKGGDAAERKPIAANASLSVPGVMRDLILSDDLYQHGVRNRDAVSLALAAKIRSSTNVKEAESAVSPDGPGNAPYGTARMMSEALELANGNPMVTALVEETKALSSKGRDPRPLFLSVRLAAGETHEREETFEARKIAALYVRGENDVPFTVVVSDSNGAEACRHEKVELKALCYWHPDQNAPYRIHISNAGQRAAALSMYTN